MGRMKTETHIKTTLAQQEALNRKASYSQCSTRKSNRRESAQRVKTSRLRRIRDIFWEDDVLYSSQQHDDVARECSTGTCSPRNFSSNASEKKIKDGTGTRTATPELDGCDSSPSSTASIEHNFGGRLRLKKIHDSPHIFTIDDFLTDSEMTKLQEKIDAAEKHRLFSKSFVDDGNSKKKKRKLKKNEEETSRTSDDKVKSTNAAKEQRTSTFVHFSKLSDTTIAAIENRAAELLSLPNHSVEPLQLVRYSKGQYFNDHHDIGVLFEDGSVELPEKNAMTPPRRIVTILVYLNDLTTESGGGTIFPLLGNGDKFSIRPKKGMAVMWCNVTKDGYPDPRLVHSGEAIKTDALKYAINIWACEE